MSEEMNKKGLMIVTVILWLIVLGLCGWMVYDKLTNKEELVQNGGNNTQTPSVTWKAEDYYNYEFVDENGNVIEYDNDYLAKLNDRYLAIGTNFGDDSVTNTAYLFDINQKKFVLKEEDTVNDSHVYAFTSLNENNSFIFLEYVCMGSCYDYFGKVYSSDAKLISDNFTDFTFDNNKNLVLLENGTITTYNNKGEILSQNNNYANVVLIDGDYIVYVDNDDVKLVVNGEILTIVSGISQNNIMEMDIGPTDDNGNVILIMRVVDRSVKVDDVWKYCTNVDEEVCRGFEKEELKSLSLGYTYKYNITTRELEKYVDIVDPWD